MPSFDSIRAANELLRNAKKPVVYAGGGVGMAGAVESFLDDLWSAQRFRLSQTLKALRASA